MEQADDRPHSATPLVSPSIRTSCPRAQPGRESVRPPSEPPSASVSRAPPQPTDAPTRECVRPGRVVHFRVREDGEKAWDRCPPGAMQLLPSLCDVSEASQGPRQSVLPASRLPRLDWFVPRTLRTPLRWRSTVGVTAEARVVGGRVGSRSSRSADPLSAYRSVTPSLQTRPLQELSSLLFGPRQLSARPRQAPS